MGVVGGALRPVGDPRSGDLFTGAVRTFRAHWEHEGANSGALFRRAGRIRIIYRTLSAGWN